MHDVVDPEVDRLARALASRTGETPTQAMVVALRERIAREEESLAVDAEAYVAAILAISRHSAALPVYDTRTPDEIVGYDEYGAPR